MIAHIEQVDHVDICNSLQECSHFASLTSPNLYCCAIRPSTKGVAYIRMVYLLNTIQPEFVAVQLLGVNSETSNTFCSFLPDTHSSSGKFSLCSLFWWHLMTDTKHIKDQGSFLDSSNTIICLKNREGNFYIRMLTKQM